MNFLILFVTTLGNFDESTICYPSLINKDYSTYSTWMTLKPISVEDMAGPGADTVDTFNIRLGDDCYHSSIIGKRLVAVYDVNSDGCLRCEVSNSVSGIDCSYCGVPMVRRPEHSYCDSYCPFTCYNIYYGGDFYFGQAFISAGGRIVFVSYPITNSQADTLVPNLFDNCQHNTASVLLCLSPCLDNFCGNGWCQKKKWYSNVLI